MDRSILSSPAPPITPNMTEAEAKEYVQKYGNRAARRRFEKIAKKRASTNKR